MAVRNRDLSGRDWLEVHAHARLGERSDVPTQEQASRPAVEVDLAIRRSVLPKVKTRPAIPRGGRG
ncbi:MAG TPA: hypothetical protein VFC19_45500 [Candidatus Limnocylindrales bacterium]|nr:hypothetical protein [Candidatus Limnocylindrales bacterium]